MTSAGCWMLVWQHSGHGGHTWLFHGPADVAKLDHYRFKDGERVGDNIDALETGPEAWVEAFESDHYSDSKLRIYPNSRIPILDNFGWGDDIDSFKMYNKKPSFWPLN